MAIDLFKPVKIRNLELKNRFVRSATWDGTADDQGRVTEESLAIYRALAPGNIGLIISGHLFVDLKGKAVSGQYGLYGDDMIAGCRSLTDIVHENGGAIAAQINHAGINHYPRDAEALVVSPSGDRDNPQRQMTGADIRKILEQYALAARRAVDAGFDVIQLHSAHGYLGSQFLSPLYNYREDEWGGNAENRRRFLVELVKTVRQAVGDKVPLIIKLGVIDEQDGGLTLEEGVRTAQEIVKYGIDAIEVSTGFGNAIRNTKGQEIVYFRDYAAAVKKAVPVPVMMVGGIRSLQTAQNIVDSGDADFISMCRPFIRNPELLNLWKQGTGSRSDCTSCSRCISKSVREKRILACGRDTVTSS
jgi:2,4-dienoyl-CoA reductase-like NADH-dependent reductase (Old Yellow Enzyme family)